MSALPASREAPLRVLLVDDEALARDLLREYLSGRKDVEIIGECADGKEALESISGLKPDLVFLDVQMPGLDGFSVIERIGSGRMPLFIFVTAYDAYAVRAFEARAIDYLLKPFGPERLNQALDRAMEQRVAMRTGEFREKVGELLALYGELRGPSQPDGPAPSESGYRERFVIKARGTVSFVPCADVDWIEAARDYVKLHVGAQSHLADHSLRSLEQELAPGRFVRIHRSTIVNLSRVKAFRATTNGDGVVILASGVELKLSRRFRGNLQSILDDRA